MLLRHLIVLIINARISSRALLKALATLAGNDRRNRSTRHQAVRVLAAGPRPYERHAGCLIGQIKLTRIHVHSLSLPGGTGSNGAGGHLFTMSIDPDGDAQGIQPSKLVL